MILFAMIFDAFDGFTARLLHVASMYGIQMDSLSDMVTFGVAPATLVAIMAHNIRELATLREFIPVCVLCSIYIGCAALRLATYNVHAIVEKKSSEKFSGLPSPGAAAAICSVVFFSSCIPENVSGRVLPVLMRFLPWYVAFLGLLMVSSIPYTHFAKWIVSTKRNRRRLIVLLCILVCWAVISFFGYGLVVPFVFINGYVFWGPAGYFLRR